MQGQIEKKPQSGINIFEIGMDLKGKIAKNVKGLPDSYALLIIVKTRRYEKLVDAILDLYTNDEKMNGVFISTNKPVPKILKALEKEGKVKPNKIYFIDCMTEMSKVEGRVEYCPPQNLTELNLSIAKLFKQQKDLGFLLLDSLSTLFIYNEVKPVEKFINTLVRKISDKKMKAVIITTKTSSNRAALDDISVFFDEVITMEI